VEEEVKSAFELAMERISGLPKLTPEEKAEQKEREFAPIGTAMAVKYMDGALADGALPTELKRYQGNQLQIVRRALISSLCREMQFESTRGAAQRALNGIAQITPERRDALEEAQRSFWAILDDYENAKDKKFLEFGASALERIKNLGISGSAVQPNLDENEQWKTELNGLRQLFEPRLEHLRTTLMREFTS